MLDWLMLITVILVSMAACGMWTQLIRQLWRRESPVAWEPAPPVPWDLLDLCMVVGQLVGFSFVFMGLVTTWYAAPASGSAVKATLEQSTASVLAQALASLATLVASAAWILLRHRVTWRELGFDDGTIVRDLRLGVRAFLILAPPTYALQLILVQWFKSEHPVVKLIRERPDGVLVAASLFSAVLVAPVFEEYFFRGLLQGWLQRFFWHAGGTSNPAAYVAVVPSAAQPKPSGTDDEQGSHSDRDLGPGAEPNEVANSPPSIADAYAPPKFDNSSLEDARWYTTQLSAADSPPAGLLGVLPLVISASIFAVLHVSHGPDWLPLFGLAIGLGYLYRQTHRLLPCIVVHFLLNGVSMGMFLLELLGSR